MSKLVFFVFLFPAVELLAQENPERSLNRKAEKELNAHPDSAFHYANQALLGARDKGDRLEQGISHQLIGEVLYVRGIYPEALKEFLEAETIFRQEADIRRLAKNLNQQGLLYYNIRQQEKALSIHQQALKFYQALEDKGGIAYSLGCVGRLYEKEGKYDRSSQYQFQALDIYRSLGDNQGVATIYENIGSILEDQEDYPGALDYFHKSLALNELTGDSLGMIINLNNVGDNYRKTGNYNKAIEFSKKALAVAQRLNNKYQISSAYKDLSKAYHLAGDDVLAYQHLETGRSLYEEIFAQDALQQMALLQSIFEMERNNHAIQQLRNANKLDTIIRVFLIAGLFFVATLAVVVVSRQRMKSKRDLAKIDQERQVFEARNKLMLTEVENTNLREKTLKQELETHSHSLTLHTLHIMGKNKMLEDIQLRLSGLLSLDREEQRKKIKEMVKLIDRNFIHDKDWDDFNRTFGQVHKNFFEKISSRSRDISNTDLRLAALIRLNLSSLDIATILGISTESLRVARYRLKKKLTLQDGESLSGFIHGIV